MIPATLALLSCLAGFVLAHGWARKQRLGIRILAVIFSDLCAIPAALFALYYLRILPEEAWFYTLRSYPGSELLAFFLGTAGGTFAALLPRSFLVICVPGPFLVALVPYLKMMISPLDTTKLKERWENGACLQSTPSTCGPSSVASILKIHGEDATERQLAGASHTTASGTEAWYLARELRARGYSPRFDFRDGFSPEAGLPAMVGVRIGGYGHFIAVLEMKGENVTVVDPLNGKRAIPLEEFRKTYVFTGFHMIVPQKTRT